MLYITYLEDIKLKLGDFDSDLTLTWDGGGVRAPLDLWVSQIVLFLPAESRKAVLDSVVAEVERRNQLVEKTNEGIAGSD